VKPATKEIALLGFQAGYPASNRAADSGDEVAAKQRDAFVAGFEAGTTSEHHIEALLAACIDYDDPPSTEAQALAREIVALVHNRGAGDIGDIRAALKRLAVHFPRTMPEVPR
jgi:hypothetical protein